MLLLPGYKMSAFDCFYITVWTCMLVPVFFLSSKGKAERNQTLDTDFAWEKSPYAFSEQRKREVIARTLESLASRCTQCVYKCPSGLGTVGIGIVPFCFA